MENFIVSARKYRPDNFKSVIGQGTITSTLKNSIKNKQLGHAYLFSGPRGVGKTTCARIFAKTINCMDLQENTEACNKCESCTSFNENRAYNIHELDAASNNSVDDIRSLTEQVRIPPQVGKYSVYIIDEVHMLSSQAFNAFLKTLEEPPAHAIFILATTEKQKIIPTILSRCQIYDFNRIRTEDAVEYLKYIAREEKIDFEEEALHVIARKAEGAMRDALSIFDQVVSFSEGKITYDSVIENLNVLSVEYYFSLAEILLNGRLPAALLMFDEILSKGFDARNFINGLASHFRDLLVSGNAETIVLLDVGPSFKERYQKQAGQTPVEYLYEALDICGETDLNFRNSKNQRLTVELALVKLASLSEVQKKKTSSGPGIASETVSEDESARASKAESPDPSDTTSTSAPLSTAEESQPDTTADDTRTDPARDSKKVPIAEPGPGSVEATSVEPGTKSDEAPTADADKTADEESPSSLATAAETNGNGRENQVVHTKSVSIKNVIKGQPREIPVDDQEIDEADVVKELEPEKVVEISEEDVRNAWAAYAESVKDDHPRIYSTLTQREPEMTTTGKIQIQLNTEAQRENFVHHIKPSLTEYLRKHLADIEYVFETNVITNEIIGKKVYTDTDKLEYMIKKNRDLEMFKSRFNLDFDE